ncbi:hypothetical protein BGX26_009464 [Mortierella sp. AD094]|nr:hypothetical protein BGX26_009464 [Mortierella sp. AD094]
MLETLDSSLPPMASSIQLEKIEERCSSSMRGDYSPRQLRISVQDEPVVDTLDFPADPPVRYSDDLMDIEDYSNSRRLAVLFFGISGSGKSTLLSQLGGGFESGVKFREGFTKEIYEETVEIYGEQVVLMDVPGLYEPDSKETENNAKILTKVLKRGYDYKLYFILKASNRGPDDKELVMMAKVNECVQQAGSNAIFRVIVNQILDEEVYDLYLKCMANDNCQRMFETLKIDGFSFNITVDSVLLLCFNRAAIKENALKKFLEKEVHEHFSSPVKLKKDLKASNNDIGFSPRHWGP